tara:strand:- start:127 stop:1941 length:1815 start_codon:yes stop_codon:yes gene_type:complete
METEQPSLKAEGQIFRIDTTRADEIEEIAKTVTTMFTSWDDFVKECLHVYIKSWTNPVKAQEIMQKVWLPHFKPIQLEYMNELMPPEEYQKFTAGMENQRKGLRPLPFNPSQMGPKFFKVDSEVLDSINEIISQPKASKKFENANEFFDEGIDLFIIWWTNPKKSQEKMFEMWPYLPDHVKNHWKENPELKGSFENFEKMRRDWCKKNGIDPDLIPKKVQSLHEPKRKTRERKKEIPEQIIGFQDSVTPSSMQTISSQANQSWVELCTNREEYIDDMERLDIPEIPADALHYDGYPLIWSFYSRFLPVKVVLTKLGNMVAENDGEPVSYEIFREEAYDAALGLSEILRSFEEKYGIKRNKKISTGLPQPPVGINSKDKEVKKYESSKERFMNHFIGMKTKVWTKRKNDDDKNDWFDGALNAMGLAYFVAKQIGMEAKSKGGKAKYEIKVGLTKLGKDFWLLDNYVIKNYKQSSWDNAFYPKETYFIMNEIIPKFPLEHIAVLNIMAELQKISDKKSGENYLDTDKIDDLFHNPVLLWVRDKKNEDVGHYRDIEKEIRKTPPNIAPWRAVTMGRLSELNLVEWDIGNKLSGSPGISKFCFKKSKK